MMLYSKLTPSERRELVAGVPQCAICQVAFGSDATAVLDHTHATDEVRDVLCRRCNSRLGQVEGGWVLPGQDELAYLGRHGISAPAIRQRENKRPKRHYVGFALHVSGDLREAVRKIAERNHRSFNSEVIVAVKRHIEAEERKG